MKRNEALRILGLEEGASDGEIKAAYREMAQILHPDRFASNKKLQERATEQFKNLQEAYELLLSGKGRSSRGATRGSAQGASGSQAGFSEVEARLAGIAAARTQLISQRDVAYDERRRGLVMAGIGAALALVFGRKLGLFAVLAGAGVTMLVWGGVQAFSAHRTILALNGHLSDLAREKKRLMEELDETE